MPSPDVALSAPGTPMLAGRVIVVTGVGPGYGQRLACEAARIAFVVLGALTISFIGQVASEITATGEFGRLDAITAARPLRVAGN